jgi:hypothetical protein
MPDKQRERFYLGQLRRCVPDIPAGDPSDCESPDFLLGSAPRRVGVEVTTFYLQPEPGERPHQELQSLKDQVVVLAEQLHARHGGPALYLTAIFGPHGRLTKRTVRPIAEALAAAVLSHPMPRSIRDPRAEAPRNLLPLEIAHVHAHGSVDGTDHLWHADAGGWVAPITRAHVQSEIARKERAAYLARAKCDELWLVIAHDMVRGAPTELSDEARIGPYEHSFDRLLWLEAHEPRVLALGVPAV